MYLINGNVSNYVIHKKIVIPPGPHVLQALTVLLNGVNHVFSNNKKGGECPVT